jgi:uncharacterized protein YjbJ (UPF0337 family)
MHKNRIKDPAAQTKDAVKEAARKIPADLKAEAKGKSDKIVFKLRNAIGGTLRGK